MTYNAPLKNILKTGTLQILVYWLSFGGGFMISNPVNKDQSCLAPQGDNQTLNKCQREIVGHE